MSSTTCKMCGAQHEIVDSTDVLAADGKLYVTYSCPEGTETTYGAVISESEVTD